LFAYCGLDTFVYALFVPPPPAPPVPLAPMAAPSAVVAFLSVAVAAAWFLSAVPGGLAPV